MDDIGYACRADRAVCAEGRGNCRLVPAVDEKDDGQGNWFTEPDKSLEGGTTDDIQ